MDPVASINLPMIYSNCEHSVVGVLGVKRIEDAAIIELSFRNLMIFPSYAARMYKRNQLYVPRKNEILGK